MIIAEGTFYPGQSGTVEVVAGQLPSGNQVSINAHVFRAFQPGPTVMFLAGVHGDEVNGVEIVRRCLSNKMFDKITAGTVIAIPLLNVYGFNNFSRDVPDGKDVNRAFPGTSTGSLASRIANGLSKNILPHLNLAVDFHTGGRGTYNFPQIRYNPEDPEAERAARAFASPLILGKKAPAKSLRRSALKNHQVSVLTFEGGENLRYDSTSIDAGVAGLHRLLYDQQMIQVKPPDPVRKTVHLNSSVWIRASRAGLFQWTKKSGYPVRKGEVIGIIVDPQAIRKDKRIASPRDGIIIGHANSAVVSQGDALFHIGWKQ
ncbi:succinylglutamate desuccinylase/aspartoacylase family protein [Neolewinella aurantiaca]|uniref:Succinylglutamate desuccinylase/aspartoacylase family protein n=2 Tax=Neolewinella aurantiaca TaxID=2602767 RepID=A0A5C7FKM6_9BACT|nr:succinylglutamate desuccinylase/aspartoacylase family protein [Neolewinella aurantiaca]